MAKQTDDIKKDKDLPSGENLGGDQGDKTPEVKEIKAEEKKPEAAPAPEAPKKIKVQLTDTGASFDNDVIKIKFHEIVEVEENDEIKKYISKRRLKVVG